VDHQLTVTTPNGNVSGTAGILGLFFQIEKPGFLSKPGFFISRIMIIFDLHAVITMLLPKYLITNPSDSQSVMGETPKTALSHH